MTAERYRLGPGLSITKAIGQPAINGIGFGIRHLAQDHPLQEQLRSNRSMMRREKPLRRFASQAIARPRQSGHLIC
jgi:hypothetical protein